MKILIFEDEPLAAERIQRMVKTLQPDVEILGCLSSVQAGLDWFEQHATPDLMLLDIHLADGSSFELFEHIDTEIPIIFTTAYDQYAIEAFRVNSVDYLLKPIRNEALAQALDKYLKRSAPSPSPPQDLQGLIRSLSSLTSDYQKRLVIKYGPHIKAVEITEIAYFFIESKVTLLRTTEGKSYAVDYNLDQLEQILDPRVFFRINRKIIIHLQGIANMYAHSKSRVKIDLSPHLDQEAIVSADRSPHFKQWLTGKPQS